eukprot:TCONS_00041100-protein
MKDNGPLLETSKVIKKYQEIKKLSPKSKMKSKEMFEILAKHLPVCVIYLSRKAFLYENLYQEVIDSVMKFSTNSIDQEDLNDHIESKIGEIYKDVIEYMDTKRDRDAFKAVISQITSIRFAAKLQGVQSRVGIRNSSQSLKGNLIKYKDIKLSSKTVRNDMTVNQQHKFNGRIATARKFKEIKTIAAGRGAPLKCVQFPELTVLLENIFAESGLESHPRLTDDILYRATSNALTMTKAREILLSLAPENFKICLSTCFNYTQNFKAGTAQAKRHHEGRDINACISLHPPPRIGTEKPSPNLHWSSCNVSLMLSNRVDDTIFDSKDAKSIVCADISPVQRPSKTWKKKEGILLDHEWNQSRINAVTPMAHLFLDDSKNEDSHSILRSG